MSHDRVVLLVALVLSGPGLALSCAPAPVASPAAAAPPSAAAVTAASAAPEAVTSAPAAPAPPPPAASSAVAEAAPPCVDGELLMGACICTRGKGVDATGHCVFMPCPKSTSGATVFRSESTGQCMECRPGKVQCGDSCCSR